jgi:hypothetical protein
MKYRLIASVLVLVFIAVAVFMTMEVEPIQSDQPPIPVSGVNFNLG